MQGSFSVPADRKVFVEFKISDAKSVGRIQFSRFNRENIYYCWTLYGRQQSVAKTELAPGLYSAEGITLPSANYFIVGVAEGQVIEPINS